MNDVIIIFNSVDSYSKEVRIFKGQLTDKDFEAAKKAHGHYINSCSCDEDSEEYKALDYFYNEVLCVYDKDKDEAKFMLEEVEEPTELKGTTILIGFLN